MTELPYETLENEIIQALAGVTQITLATCAGNRVFARTICPLNDGLTILFSTLGKSEKARQMKENPNIALAIGNLQIEAVAQNAGHPDRHTGYTEKYNKKYPQFAGLYPPESDDIVVIARPTKISLYKYLGKPCEEVLDVQNKRAYRISLP